MVVRSTVLKIILKQISFLALTGRIKIWLVLFGAFGFGVRSGSCGSKYFDRSSGFDRFYFHFSGPIVLRGYRVSSETGRVLQKIGEITF